MRTTTTLPFYLGKGSTVRITVHLNEDYDNMNVVSSMTLLGQNYRPFEWGLRQIRLYVRPRIKGVRITVHLNEDYDLLDRYVGYHYDIVRITVHLNEDYDIDCPFVSCRIPLSELPSIWMTSRGPSELPSIWMRTTTKSSVVWTSTVVVRITVHLNEDYDKIREIATSTPKGSELPSIWMRTTTFTLSGISYRMPSSELPSIWMRTTTIYFSFSSSSSSSQNYRPFEWGLRQLD